MADKDPKPETVVTPTEDPKPVFVGVYKLSVSNAANMVGGKSVEEITSPGGSPVRPE